MEAALAGEPYDRIPVSVWRHRPTRDQTADDLVAAMVEEQRRFDWDFVKVMSNRLHCVEDCGTEIHWPQTPEAEAHVLRYVVQEPKDWTHLEPLDPHKGALGREVEVVRRLVDELGSEVPIVATLYSPLTVAFKLADEKGIKVFDHLESHPGEGRAGLDAITETVRRTARAYMDAGADGVFYAVQMAGHPRFTREIYEKFCRQDDQSVLEEVAPRSRLSILHLHGSQLVDIDIFLSLPVEALNWHDQIVGPSMAEVRAMTGKVLAAGIPDHLAMVGKKDAELAALFDRTLRASGPRSVVLAPGCTVDHWQIEDRQLHFIRAWAEEWRSPA
mgnify:CR=1 FL=1